MVWDSKDLPSAIWISGPTFTTISHAYPSPDFTPNPQNPPVDTIVVFNRQF